MTTLPAIIIAERAAEPAIPAELGQPADEDARDGEPDEVAAGGADEDRQPALALGEERQADQAERDVQRDRGEPTAGPERAGRDQHAEGLAGQRDRRTDDVDLGGQEDEQRAGHHERDVADARVDALGDADGDQEIGDREATFRGRRAVEARDGDGHRDSGARVTER